MNKNKKNLKKLSWIYRITSPNNRIYIGQSIYLQKRLQDYQKYNKTSFQVRLKASFEKYGIENHKFEVIEECSVDKLNERERYWQEHYNVLSEKGLNCKYTKTTDKSGELSPEVKMKISKSLLGSKRTDEQKERMSKVKIGKKQSEETVSKRASKIKEYMKHESYRDKFKNNEKKVYQYSLEYILIKEWRSVREASRELHIDCSSIVKAISHKYPNKTANGFIWSYTNKPDLPVLKN